MVQRKRVKKATRGYESRFFPNERDAKKCQDALYEYDNVVRGYETKWGIDRLPTLVEAELRDRFWAQLDLLNEAIAKGSGVEVEQAVRSTIRGCEALERRAVDLGAEPVSGELWGAVTPVDGTNRFTTLTNAAVRANVDPRASSATLGCSLSLTSVTATFLISARYVCSFYPTLSDY